MSTESKRRLLAGLLLSSAVLTGCVSQNDYDKLEAENTLLRQQATAQSAQHAADEAEIAAGKGQITRLQGALKYTVESDLMFAPGSWQLSDQGKQTLAEITPKLAPTQQKKLVVHGYTDNTPIGPRLEQEGVSSNTELSRMRAEAVRQFLIAQGVEPDMVTAVGHGAANPVAENDTAQGRSQNRRVELTLEG